MVFTNRKHVDLAELMRTATVTPAKQDLVKGKGFRALVVSLREGQRIEPHEEPNGVLFVVLAGEGIIMAGDERY